MDVSLNIVDLFCGCGGFGLGAELAGFNTLVAVDVDETLQSAYRKNFPRTQVLTADLSSTEAEFWSANLGSQVVDGVIGGPPCQGYSRMGVSDLNDPRRSLLRHFFRNINIIQPKFFVMENVEGLMDEKNRFELDAALRILDKRYTVTAPIIVDAADFGAPTKRRRVIVIGYDPRLINAINVESLIKPGLPSALVEDAIKDLGPPVGQSKNPRDFGWGRYIEVGSLSSYARQLREAPPEYLGWKEAKSQLLEGNISGFFDTTHSDSVRKRYAETVPNTVDKVSRAKKLAWNGHCPTLRAGTGADKGSHQAVRPIHPEQPRVITVREAARLQGFPDWFVFHNTKWHSFRMIGNSVSPIVSKAILSEIKASLILKQDKEAVNY